MHGNNAMKDVQQIQYDRLIYVEVYLNADTIVIKERKWVSNLYHSANIEKQKCKRLQVK